MRKIEVWMIDTVTLQRLASKDKLMNNGLDALTATKDNTMIRTRLRCNSIAVTTVYLHGNMIAQLSDGEWGFNLAGWNTPTTKSRINALAKHWGRAGVHQKNKVLYSGNKQINVHDWF